MALIVGGTAYLSRGGDRSVPPAPQPIEHGIAYGAGQVPSLLGYSEVEARKLLEDDGYRVRVTRERAPCDVPGQVLRSSPAPGTVMARGGTVDIWVAGPALALSCTDPVPWTTVWSLVRLARGLPSGARFADTVTATVQDAGGADVATLELTGSEASDPASWTTCSAGACRSALGGVAEVATGRPDFDTTAFLRGSVDGSCHLPARATRRPGAEIWLEWPQDGIFLCRSSFIVRTDAQGRIAAVTYVAPPAP